MPYYRVCSFCGAHLDPDEKCDCQKVRGEADGNRNSRVGAEERQHRDPGRGSRNPLKMDIGTKEQQESGADGL